MVISENRMDRGFQLALLPIYHYYLIFIYYYSSSTTSPAGFATLGEGNLVIMVLMVGIMFDHAVIMFKMISTRLPSEARIYRNAKFIDINLKFLTAPTKALCCSLARIQQSDEQGGRNSRESPTCIQSFVTELKYSNSVNMASLIWQIVRSQ